MNQLEYAQEDRDRSIRVEAEVKHIEHDVSVLKVELKDLVEMSRNQAFTVAALVDGIKEIRAYMESAKQDRPRLDAVEREIAQLKKSANDTETLKQELDRWKFLVKVISAVIGSPVAIYTIVQVLQWIQMVPK